MAFCMTRIRVHTFKGGIDMYIHALSIAFVKLIKCFNTVIYDLVVENDRRMKQKI